MDREDLQISLNQRGVILEPSYVSNETHALLKSYYRNVFFFIEDSMSLLALLKSQSRIPSHYCLVKPVLCEFGARILQSSKLVVKKNLMLQFSPP